MRGTFIDTSSLVQRVIRFDKQEKRRGTMGRSVRVTLCVITIVLILFLLGATAYCERLNPETDIVYLGAFRLPTDTAGSNYGWGYGLEAMTYYPKGDPNGPNDGFPGSLFATNHTYEKYVAEISIPVPVNSKDLSQLNRATTLQNFHDINRGTYSTSYMEMEICYLPRQGSQTSDKLYISWNSWYNVSDSDVDRYGWCELDLSNPNTQGPWNLGHGEVNVGTVGEYLFEIPGSWAAQHTPGKLLAAGKYREGGCAGGGYRYGGGPGLHAFGPWNHGNPPAPGTELDQVTLLSYAGGHIWQCPANGDTCKVGDKWDGGAWITAGNKSAVVFVGRKGLGEDSYGEHCAGKGYYNTGGYKPYMLFYDPDDLADVAEGRKQPYEPQPYATLDCSQYAFKPFGWCKDAGFSSAAYDREHQLLYVTEPHVDGDKAVIHVFKIKSDNITTDSTPPSRFNPSPSGVLAPGTKETTISLSTDEPCNCKYSTTPGVSYDSMEYTFENTNSTQHSQHISGLSDGASYTYYVRCMDEAGNANEDDFAIEFSVASGETTVSVSTVEELENAVANLHSNTEILITKGIYHLNNTLVINGVQNVTIKGATGNPEDVILEGPGMSNNNYGNAGFGIVIANAQDVTIKDLTVKDFYFHDIMIKGEEGAQRPVLRNLHLKDAGEQLIKVTAAAGQSSYCDNGIVENCVIEYTDRARSRYTNGISALAVKGWIVRDNTFRNIRAPEGQIAGPTILFWQNSIDTIVERNRIINCDMGIAFGNSSGPGQYARDGETTYDHQGGIIRNNFIFRNQPGDVGISVNKARDFQIVNNTVILQGTFYWTIEYRFAPTQGVIAYNLTDGNILARDGASATLTGNTTSIQSNWFTDLSAGDLHLTSNAQSVIDHGGQLASVSDDIDGESRNVGIPDVGADEYQSSGGSQDTTPPGYITDLQATPRPEKVTFTWTNPTDDDFAGVMIRFRTDGTYPQDMNDGNAVPNGNDGKIAGSPGESGSYLHDNLDPTKKYYYSFFAYDTSGNYSHPVHIVVQPLATNHAPVISSFTVSPTSISNPYETATFTASATDPDGDTLTYKINFGDGNSSSGNNVTHTYTQAGQYTATLTVSDGNGGISTKELTVNVNDLPPSAPTGVQVQ